MKIKILIFIVTTLVFCSIYFVLDSELYYYGKSNYNIFKNTLPLNLNPDYLGSRISYPLMGFTIIDKSGLIKIGKNITLNIDTDTIKIEKVLKYGFNNKIIITVIEASNGNIYNIKLFQHAKNRLDYKILSSQEINNINNLTWIEINRSTDKEKLRSFTVFFFIVFVIVFFTMNYIINKLNSHPTLNGNRIKQTNE